MHEDPAALDALLAQLDELIQGYRAMVARAPHEDALRVLQAVDAAAAAVERVRRRYTAEAHEQARRALTRAQEQLTEARRKDAPRQD